MKTTNKQKALQLYREGKTRNEIKSMLGEDYVCSVSVRTGEVVDVHLISF